MSGNNINAGEQRDEIRLSDILRGIERYKFLFLIFPLLAVLGAIVTIQFILHPKWEASFVLQIGQVAQLGQGPRVIEPPVNVVSRMTQPSFIDAVLNDSFKSDEENQLKAIFSQSLKVINHKDSDLIEVKVRGYSSEMAKALAEAIIKHLQSVHYKMMEPSVIRMNGQMKAVSLDIQAIKDEMKLLITRLDTKNNWGIYNATLSATVLNSKSNELRDLTQRKLLLEELLSSSMTFNTRTVEAVSVSEGPVSPPRSFIISLSVLLGILCAIVVASVHHFTSMGTRHNSVN